MPSIAATIPLWLFIAAVPTAAMLGYFLARRRNRNTDQTFVLISALTHTRWLADVLDNLSQSLDHHGIDLIVKLPAHDHTGSNFRPALTDERRPSLAEYPGCGRREGKGLTYQGNGGVEDKWIDRGGEVLL